MVAEKLENQQQHHHHHHHHHHHQGSVKLTSNISPSSDPLYSIAAALRPSKPSPIIIPSTTLQNPKMELHDATGTILREYPVSDTNAPTQQTHQQAPQQTHQSAQHQHAQQHPSQQGNPKQEPSAVQGAQHPQPSTHPQQAHQDTPANGPQPTTNQPPSTSTNGNTAQQLPSQPVQNLPKKPTRMPGTKQCPSCQNTIAAAVAKCPKCSHVFREKKEKVKRSGKRGKKNCPKCNYENPSACSSCKSCKHVFRLKLMDKYKAMRPRQSSENAVAAAAAAAHAAANMAHETHAGVTAVATVPLPAGVATFSNPIAGQIHQAHVIPPLTQHSIAMHHQQHNVHPTSMSQVHPMPQAGMHPHQTHPQL